MATKKKVKAAPKTKKAKSRKPEGLNSTGFLKKDVSKLSVQTLKKHFDLAESVRMYYEAEMFKSEAVGFSKPGKSGIPQVVVFDYEIQQALYAQLKPFAEHRDKVVARLKKLGWTRVYRTNGYEWFKTKKK